MAFRAAHPSTRADSYQQSNFKIETLVGRYCPKVQVAAPYSGCSSADYARYCGEYYTSERVTENLDFLVKGVQTVNARHAEPLLQAPPPGKATVRRRK